VLLLLEAIVCSTVTPGARSIGFLWVTSITANSVTTFPHPTPVNGGTTFFKNFWFSCFVYVHHGNDILGRATKSIAPPTPFYRYFPVSNISFSATSIAPRIVRSTFENRIIPKLKAESKGCSWWWSFVSCVEWYQHLPHPQGKDPCLIHHFTLKLNGYISSNVISH
jgi:hypothetical protein